MRGLRICFNERANTNTRIKQKSRSVSGFLRGGNNTLKLITTERTADAHDIRHDQNDAVAQIGLKRRLFGEEFCGNRLALRGKFQCGRMQKLVFAGFQHLRIYSAANS